MKASKIKGEQEMQSKINVATMLQPTINPALYKKEKASQIF